MATDTWIGKKGFRYYYYKFRDSEYYGLAIIGFTLLVCGILLFNIIIPEVTRWFSIRNEVIATQARIAILQKNINFINNLDKNALNSQLQTVSDALPPEKNFGFMLNALSNAAADSGVSLGDYAFQVGTIGSSKGPGPKVATLPNNISTIEITVIVNGNIASVKHFIKSLENNLPISQIMTVNGSQGNVSIRLDFYQRPFSNVIFSSDNPLLELPTAKVNLLRSLASEDKTSGEPTALQQTSSSSAVPLF